MDHLSNLKEFIFFILIGCINFLFLAYSSYLLVRHKILKVLL